MQLHEVTLSRINRELDSDLFIIQNSLQVYDNYFLSSYLNNISLQRMRAAEVHCNFKQWFLLGRENHPTYDSIISRLNYLSDIVSQEMKKRERREYS